MADEVKNLKGVVIGRIKTEEDLQCAYDIQDKLVGKYNPKTNTTYTKDGRSLGYGNQLSALLYK